MRTRATVQVSALAMDNKIENLHPPSAPPRRFPPAAIWQPPPP
jgi:hypothetical protein